MISAIFYVLSQGRVAQLGFAASIIGEAFTGKGPLAQFDFETGIPLIDTEVRLFPCEVRIVGMQAGFVTFFPL